MSNVKSSTKNNIENVIVIGGGPAGLATSIYLARANLDPLVIAGSPPGGQLILTSKVENYPGFESILGPDLIEKFRSQAKKFGVRLVDENVVKVDFSKRPFKTNTSNKTYESYSIIIATGAKALWLGLVNEQRFRGKGVSACATCDAFFFKNKIVAVVGGGDTAMEEANTLTKFASKVYIVHRRSEFRASKIMQDRIMKNPKIEILWNTEVIDVLGNQRVEGIQLKSVKKTDSTDLTDSTDCLLKIDGLFLAIGHKPDTDLFINQLELDSKGYIITSARKAIDLVKSVKIGQSQLKSAKTNFNFEYQYLTSINGVFAAGDCVDYKYRQAGTAVGMGIAAALEIERLLGSVKSVKSARIRNYYGKYRKKNA